MIARLRPSKLEKFQLAEKVPWVSRVGACRPKEAPKHYEESLLLLTRATNHSHHSILRLAVAFFLAKKAATFPIFVKLGQLFARPVVASSSITPRPRSPSLDFSAPVTKTCSVPVTSAPPNDQIFRQMGTVASSRLVALGTSFRRMGIQ